MKAGVCFHPPARPPTFVCVCARARAVMAVQLICRIVKMGWFDVDAKDTHVMRDLVSRVGQFLNVRRAGACVWAQVSDSTLPCSVFKPHPVAPA